jgi:hypothetical protein
MMMKVTSVESFDTPTVTSECHDEAPVADDETCHPDVNEPCGTSDCCEGTKACGASEASVANEAKEANEACEANEAKEANEACEAKEADEMTEVEDVGNACENVCGLNCEEEWQRCQQKWLSKETGDCDNCTSDNCVCYAGMPDLIPLYDDETGDNESRHFPAATTLDKVKQEVAVILVKLQEYKIDYFIAGAMTQYYLPSVSNAVLAYVSAIPLLILMNHPDWITDLPAENPMLLPGMMLILALSTSSSLIYASQIF